MCGNGIQVLQCANMQPQILQQLLELLVLAPEVVDRQQQALLSLWQVMHHSLHGLFTPLLLTATETRLLHFSLCAKNLSLKMRDVYQACICTANSGATSDLTTNRVACMLFWHLPCLLAILGTTFGVRRWLWTLALLVMGTGCFINTTRCNRLHCYLTGPLFLCGACFLASMKFIGLSESVFVFTCFWGGMIGTIVGYSLEWVCGSKYYNGKMA